MSWWFSTGVWVIASLFKSLGLFLVFWLSSTMLLLGWFPLVLLFPPVLVAILWRLYWAYQLQLVSPSLLCSIFFSVLKQSLGYCYYHHHYVQIRFDVVINLHELCWQTIVEGDPKAPFLIATTLRCRGGCYSFP